MSFTCKPLEGIYGELVDKGLGIKNFLYEYNPGNFVYPSSYKNYAQKILDAPVQEDDTWLVSYPRTGSTWCQEMIWLIGNNLNFDMAQNILLHYRAPFIEASTILFPCVDVLKEKFTDSVEYVNNLPSPRFIRSHLPYQLLPSEIHNVKPKIICTIRNPKDVCVSFYHFSKVAYEFNMGFETYCELFLNGAVVAGNILNHYLEFWNRRHEKNILILRYEEMTRDTRETLKKIGSFMKRELSDKDLDALEEFLSFRQMRENKSCNNAPLIDSIKGEDFYKRSGLHFFRKGVVGDWKNHMSPEMSNRFDEWIRNRTAGTDLHFN